jgi:putative PEP-CTERM system histidine kinase
MTQFLLWLNLICAVPVAVLILRRRTYPAATLLFSGALLLLAGLCWVELQLLQQPTRLLFWQKYVLLLELGTVFCFYYYTKTVFRDNSEIYKGPGFWISLLLALALTIYVAGLSTDALIFSPDFAEERILYLTKAGFAVYLLLMLYLVFGLVQLERTLAGLHQLQRWATKLEVIASGLLLVSFALYFSHSLLYRSIDLNYLGWRSLLLIVAVLLFAYARLVHDSSSRLALSRGIAHRSFVLLIVGGYLIILGLVGEGLRYLNVANASVIFYGLLIVGSLALALIFLSERLRRKLKVLLHKNFYQSKYDYREQWQKFAAKVSYGTDLAVIQTSLLDLFSDTLACKGAALYLFDSESASYKPAASFNLRRDWRPFADTDPLIQELRQRDWIINLTEDNPELQGSLIGANTDVNLFLVVPLFFDESLEGFILLGEQINPDEILTYEDYDLLRMLARQTIATIQGLRLAEQLTASRELAAIGKVSTFVLHDLKNQVSGLALMLDNAADHIEDPEFQQDMLETVGNTVTNMRKLMLRLKNLKDKPELVMSRVSLAKIATEAAKTAGGQIEITGKDVQVGVDEEEIYKVILNLLVNAAEASAAGATVCLDYGCSNGSAWVRVRDQGCGMSAEFIEEKLFQPFATTKKHGFGIGLHQCRQIAEAHGGKIDVESREGEGSSFTLTLPLAEGESREVKEE